MTTTVISNDAILDALDYLRALSQSLHENDNLRHAFDSMANVPGGRSPGEAYARLVSAIGHDTVASLYRSRGY